MALLRKKMRAFLNIRSLFRYHNKAILISIILSLFSFSVYIEVLGLRHRFNIDGYYQSALSDSYTSAFKMEKDFNNKFNLMTRSLDKQARQLAILSISKRLNSTQIVLSRLGEKAFGCSGLNRLSMTECLLLLTNPNSVIQQSTLFSQNGTPLASTEPLGADIRPSRALATYRAIAGVEIPRLISSDRDIFYVERNKANDRNPRGYFVALLPRDYLKFNDNEICSYIANGSVAAIYSGDGENVYSHCSIKNNDSKFQEKSDYDAALGVHIVVQTYAPYSGLSMPLQKKVYISKLHDFVLFSFNVFILCGALSIAIFTTIRSRPNRGPFIDTGDLKIIIHELINDMLALKSLSHLLHIPEQEGRNGKVIKALRLNCDSVVSYLDGVSRSLTINNHIISSETCEINLYELICDMLEVYKLQSENKGLDFISTIDIDSSVLWRCEPILIRHVIRNLLGNAIKYTKNGTVNILVSIDKTDDAYRLRIVVEDTGCGLLSDSNIDIFAPFVRGENASQVATGFGVGLHICQMAANQMNGCVYFEHLAHGGTRFVFEGDIESGGSACNLQSKSCNVVLAGLSHPHTSYLTDLFKLNDIKTDVSNDSFTTVAVCERIVYHSDRVDLLLLDSSIEGESPDVIIRKCLTVCGENISNIAVIGKDLSFLSNVSTSVVMLSYPLDEKRILSLLGKHLRQNCSRDYPNIKILLIEDNHVNAFFLKAGLEDCGCSVFPASSGEEGLGVLKREMFDCVLLDLRLPGLSGPAVATQIRTVFQEKSPVIVGITAHCLEEVSDECTKAGMNGVLSKRSDLDGIVSFIREQLAYTERNIGVPSSEAKNLIFQNDDLKFDFSHLKSCQRRLGDSNICQLIRELCEDTPELFRDLKDASMENQFEKGQDLSHKFIGTFYQLGAMELHDRLLAFEDACRDLDGERAKNLVYEVETSWKYVHHILMNFISEIDTKNAA